MTCNPAAGLVQIPCNATPSARLDLHGDGRYRVSLDSVIATVRETGADM
jgi:L-serine dehydratase